MNKALPDKLLRLLSIGRLTFSKDEVPSLLEMSLSSFEDASQRAISRGRLLRPHELIEAGLSASPDGMAEGADVCFSLGAIQNRTVRKRPLPFPSRSPRR